MYRGKKHRGGTLRSSARGTLPALACLMVLGSGSPGIAEDTGRNDTVSGTVGSSPVIDAMLAETDPDVRPLMKIGEMQAWVITYADGTPVTALTTADGLTIVGQIIGPQGEDISAALLATMPDPSVTVPSTRALVLQAPGATPAPTPQAAMTPIPDSQGTPSGGTSSALRKLQRGLRAGAASEIAPTRDVEPPDTPSAGPATAALTAIDQPSADVQAGLNAVFRQAGDERVWFSAGTPRPDAPVIYMLTDPECPHCQWTIDQMQGSIASGSVDLRIIFAPVTGVQGFNTALSILHFEDIAQTFMAHMTSNTRGTSGVVQMDTTQADKAVIQGIVDNINWMRANKMPGVPFFLFDTDQGAQFAFSELPPDILTVAKAASQ
ncbi:hypothetical protein [Roseovarius dicentrarchi]|uniref:hypothetical protein n=1 Tax=Roseovarius dicentrarchi TaxID=2250573 RepID=UPI000DE93C7B|nr:hypothetical protein [Roseovarius dicentrarchi]